MNAAQIKAIKQGDLGLYEWDRKCPVVKVHPVLDILIGPKKGFLFRYVEVLSATGNATIGFIVEQSEVVQS